MFLDNSITWNEVLCIVDIDFYWKSANACGTMLSNQVYWTQLMYSKEKLEAVFLEKDLGKLDMALSAIGDELECASLTSDETISIVNYFLSRIEKFTNKTIIENILHISLRIMDAHNTFCGFNFDIVLPHLHSMDAECSSYVLTFLGFSGDLKYEKVIENFLQNGALKKEAEEALSELRYRAKRNYTALH